MFNETKMSFINNRQKTQLLENIKFTSYIFQPSRGHLQADVWNILGSMQIMCRREISLLTGLCYKSGLWI